MSAFVSKVLFSEGLDLYVVRRLGLKAHDVKWGEWDELLKKVHHPKHQIKVGLVGKYIDLPDAYLSVSEALRAGGFAKTRGTLFPPGRTEEFRFRHRPVDRAPHGRTVWWQPAVCLASRSGADRHHDIP